MASVERLGQNKPSIVRQMGGTAVITPVNGSLKVPVLTDTALTALINDPTSAAALALTGLLAPLDAKLKFGAKGDGVTNDRAALSSAEALGAAHLSAGTYRVSSNLTLSGAWTFDSGAMLKPDNGVTITMAGTFNAPQRQIFDHGAGGTVTFAPGIRLSEVSPFWWGAMGRNATSSTADSANPNFKGTGLPFDDTAAFQAAFDASSAGGGALVAAPMGKYGLTQVVFKRAVYLRGEVYSIGGIGPASVGTEFVSVIGANKDMFRVEQDGTGGYAVEHGMSHVIGYGATGMTDGSFYALKDASGTPLRWQHGCFVNHVIGRRFAKDVMFLGGGSGVQHIHTIFGYMNGGYTVRIVNNADPDAIQFIYLADISGDGNLGDGTSSGGTGAVVRIEGQSAGYSAVINGLKSEQIVNANFASAGAPAGVNALHLVNCAGFVHVNGLEHISSSNNTDRPGDAIVVSGSVRPTVKWTAAKIRTRTGQVTGPVPALLRDTVGGGNLSIPQDVIDGAAGPTVDVRWQSVSGGRVLAGEFDAHVKPSSVSTEMGVAGATPGTTSWAVGGAADEKGYLWLTSADGKTHTLYLVGDDGTLGDEAIKVTRSGKTFTSLAIGGRQLNADQLATGQESVDRGLAGTTNGLTSGQIRLAYFTARKTETVTKLRTVSGTAAGATPTLCKVGLYTVAANGDLTLVASTANTTSLWAAASTGYETALSSSYGIVTGVRYAVATICVTAAAAPTITGALAGDVGKGPRLCGLLTGQTDLPSSITAASVGDSSNRPYVALLP